MSDGFHVGETVELKIESLAFQGYGVGKRDGFVFFVDHATPGDTILAKVSTLKKKFAHASLEKIIAPSELRQQPTCSHFPACGGCQWQHVSYHEQVAQKEKILRRTFGIDTIEVVPSPLQFSYRNRIRLHWDGSCLGMHRRKSSELLPIEKCQIAVAEISDAIEKTKQRLEKTFPGKRKHVDLFVVEGTIHTNITDFDDHEYPPFSQVNHGVNEKLKEHVLNCLPENSQTILDLYCGNGNFTALAKQKSPTSEVIGVESNRTSIDEAKKNHSQIEFIANDVAKFLKKWSRPTKTLTVILDPPRSGCQPAVLAALTKINPQTIIYISCDPTTLSRDIKQLTGHRLKDAKGFDMFPQTYHVETVALLNSSSI